MDEEKKKNVKCVAWWTDSFPVPNRQVKQREKKTPAKSRVVCVFVLRVCVHVAVARK
jgi:hypothetical protein